MALGSGQLCSKHPVCIAPVNRTSHSYKMVCAIIRAQAQVAARQTPTRSGSSPEPIAGVLLDIDGKLCNQKLVPQHLLTGSSAQCGRESCRECGHEHSRLLTQYSMAVSLQRL